MDSGILDRSLLNEAMASEIGARSAVSANPRDQRAQQALCEILLRQNRLDEAATALRKAIAWLPDVPSLRIQLAFVLARQGQHVAARQTLNQAAEHTQAGSRIHAEIVETAALPAPAMPMPAPHEATAPMGHLRPLVMEPAAEIASQPGVVRLGLDDVASFDLAELVRAGQIARAEAAEEDLAASVETSVAPAWQARPAPSMGQIIGWRLVGIALVAFLVVCLASAMVTRRIASHAPDETRFTSSHAVTALVTLPPKPAPKPLANPAPAKPVAIPPPPLQQQQPAALSALPEAALPLVTLAYEDTGDTAQQQAGQVQARLVQAGIDVSALKLSAAASTGPGITYFYQEDREAAVAILRILGDRFGPVQAVTALPESKPPGPGTIVINLPGSRPR